ncbi:MAG: tetratricopeptide repeat protein [Chthoniobacteraceae bacterium]
MKLAEQLRVLQVAQGDPAKLALATVDLKYPELSEKERATLKETLEAAAIPHWCDEAVLAALLEIPRKQSATRLTQLRALTIVESFPARGNTAVNVHEASRLALRQSLATNQTDRFCVLSARAEKYFKSDLSSAGRIERIFHRLWLDPKNAGPEMRQLEFDLRHKVEDGLALAASLREYISDNSTPLVKCWASWAVATVEEPYLKVGRQLELASLALECAEASGCAYANATTTLLIAGVLCERGQAGDAKNAFRHYQHSLKIYERLLKANPKSAQAARDVALSMRHFGDFLTDRGQSGDARKAFGYFRRCLEIDERLLKANPKSTQAARDVSLSVGRFGMFLANRGQSGDAKKTLGYYRRSLKINKQLLKTNPHSAQSARDVAVSVHRLADFLAERGQAGDAKKALKYYDLSLEIDEQLLKANPESAQAARDVTVDIHKLADFLARRGQAGDVRKALALYQRSLNIHERLLKANPESAQAARRVAVSVGRLADFLAERGRTGDAEKALGYYRRSLEIDERLFKANPNSALVARDMAVSLNTLGDFLANRGQTDDTKKALDHYEQSLKIHERLLKANPDSAQAARDVSVGLHRLGDFLANRGQTGDAKKALDHYERSLKIHERLLKANPESAQAARDVAVSIHRMGNFLANRGQTGDAKKALNYYDRSLKIHERLLKANPESAHAARDVSVGLHTLGDFLAKRGQAGDAKKALDHYERCLKIHERLLKANPESAHAARDVAVGLHTLGGFLTKRGKNGDIKRAFEYYKRGLLIHERLLKLNPESARAARDVSVSVHKLADFLAKRGQLSDAKKALEYHKRSLEIDERLLKFNPESAQAARDVSVSTQRLADFLAKRGQAGDTKEALYHYQRCLQIEERLLKAKPESAQVARDLVVSNLKLSHFYNQLGDTKQMKRSLAACFAILDSQIRKNHSLDTQIKLLYDRLALLFVKTGKLTSGSPQNKRTSTHT